MVCFSLGFELQPQQKLERLDIRINENTGKLIKAAKWGVAKPKKNIYLETGQVGHRLNNFQKYFSISGHNCTNDCAANNNNNHYL